MGTHGSKAGGGSSSSAEDIRAEQVLLPVRGASANANTGNIQAEQNTQTETAQQKPTHARQIADMNEAQLVREIARLERQTAASAREVDRASNTQSMRFFRDIGEAFPGGVGGSAIDARYRRMQERNDRDMQKLIEAQGKYSQRSETLQRMKDALEQVRGTGKTLRTVATATASKGNGTWSPTTISIYGKATKGHRMGDYVVAKPFYTYNIYDARTGKQIRTFKSKKAAQEWAEKQ